MYFNHAFRKSFLASTTTGILDLASTGDTSDLVTTPGKIGLFNAKTYGVITAAPVSGNVPFILAQGSYFTNDKIGPVHGGYQESVKSKVINPKYISRVFTTTAVTPQQQVISVGWDLEDGPGFVFECGKTYRLRIDLKGSPTLRFLSHNLYRTMDAFSGCCTDDCSATCTGAPVDAACVLLKWKDQINQNPLVSQFVQAQVYIKDGASAEEVFSQADEDAGLGTAYVCNIVDPTTVIAGIKLTIAYEDTKFGACTFTPTDHYELQPLLIFASVLDETGEPCAIKPIGNTSTGELVTEITAPRQVQGRGDSVVRDLILSGRYRQEAFPDSSRVESLRMREIEGNPGVLDMLDVTKRTALFDSINILHNVPRLNNPTGTFDNDQYLLTIYVPAGTNYSAFVDPAGGNGLLDDILALAGNGVVSEAL
jgi:hypothetical protein